MRGWGAAIYGFILSSTLLYSQELPIQIASQVESMLEQGASEQDAQQILEIGSDIIATPININQTSGAELEQLGILSASQIEDLLYYLYRYGPIKEIYELQLVSSLDKTTIDQMIPFVEIGAERLKSQKLDWKRLFKYAKQEFKFQIRSGIHDKKGGLDGSYWGDPLYLSFRYRYKITNHLHIGITAEKDSYEPWRNNKSVGFDFYSIQAAIYNIGILKTAVVGDYRASFGYGLVLSHDFRMGRSGAMQSIGKLGRGFTPHTSVDETHYFRGVAATIAYKRWGVSLFYSNRDLDSNYQEDTLTSISTAGLHRTEQEIERKWTLNNQSFGGHLSYSHGALTIGLTAVSSFLKGYIVPPSSLYALHALQGNTASNIGLYYKYRWSRLTFMAEVAYSISGGWATLQAVEILLPAQIRLLLLYRYYDPQYRAMYARTFSHQSRPQNETGFYMAVDWRVEDRWRISMYADVYRFPWVSYYVQRPTYGADIQLQVDYTHSQKLSSYFRYRYREGERNQTLSTPLAQRAFFEDYKGHQLRLSALYRAHSVLSMQSTLEYNLYQISAHSYTSGAAISQSFTYRSGQIPLQIALQLTLFDTATYNNRIYLYQRSLPGMLSTPLLDGQGLYLSTIGGYKFGFGLTCGLSLSWVYYTDRDRIGTALETIYSPHKVNISLSLSYKI